MQSEEEEARAISEIHLDDIGRINRFEWANKMSRGKIGLIY